MTSASGDVDVAYSQIELHPGAGGHVWDLHELGLVRADLGDHVILTTPREDGTVTVDVEVLEGPAPPDPGWDTAVEFSVRIGQDACVSGWAGSGRVVVPVPAGLEVRIRYVVIDGEAASPWSEEPDTESERYLLQLWPAPPSAAESIAATTPWCQYWAFGPAAEALVAELSDVPDPDRLGVVIDRALSDHPGVARRLREGQLAFQSGIVRYAQELFRVTYASDAYADVRHDSIALRRLITERAARIV